VTIQLVITYSPATPTAVANVGTNINTAGTVMIEDLIGTKGGVDTIQTNGYPAGAGVFEFGGSPRLCFASSVFTQNGAPGNGLAIFALNSFGAATWTNVGGSRGTMTVTYSASVTTSGQTLYGLGLAVNNSSGVVADVLFTTPQTAPTGTFQPNTVWQMVFNRALSN